MKRPAFTLLELLVSSALFAVIVVLMVGIIATTAVSQNAGLQSQVVSSELQQSLNSFKGSLGRVDLSTLQEFSGDNDNSYLFFQTTPVQADGTSSGVPHYEVWCVPGDGTSSYQNHLLQFTLPVGAILKTLITTGFVVAGQKFKPSPLGCDISEIAGQFTDAQGNQLQPNQVGINQITDDTVTVTSFYTDSYQVDVSTKGAEAYNIELSGTYAAPGEVRADTQLSQPIVVRGTAVLVSNPNVSNSIQ